MPRSFFDGEGTDQSETKSYTPGDSGGLEHLVRRVLRAHERQGFMRFRSVHIPPSDISDMQKIPTELASEFVQKLVLESLYLEPVLHKNIQFLLSPIINTLYGAGGNDFVIDLRDRTQVDPLDSQGQGTLNGHRSEPIRLQYLLSDHRERDVSVGNNTDHCEIHIDGEVKLTGRNANRSTFHLERVPLMIGNPYMQSSLFYLYGVNDYLGMKPGVYPSRRQIAMFRVGDAAREVSIPDNFRYSLNHLYIPDGKGGWKKVVGGNA